MARGANFTTLLVERFPPQNSNQQSSSGQNQNEPQGWPGPSSHPSTPQFQTHSRSASGSRNHSPRLTPGNISVEYAPPQSSHFTQIRSPALSSNSSLHGSPLPGYAQLSASESPRPRDEYFLPESSPHPGSMRPRASSAGSGSGIGALGLGTLNLQESGRPHLQTMGSAPPPPNQHHYGALLHPQTALDGSFLSPNLGGANLRRSKSDAASGHRKGVKSEDFHGNYNDLLGPQPNDLIFNPSSSMEFLTPPSSTQRRPGHGRHASLGNSPMMSHGSGHNYAHHSARTSPYPSPHASPSSMRIPLPDPSGGLGLNVFETYGASGMNQHPQDIKPGMLGGPGGSPGMMGQMLPGIDPANPPKKLVTTKATHDASVSRRKNDAAYACPVPGCGSTFTRSFNLKGGLFCSSFFNFIPNLFLLHSGHMRSHMEERPFKCKWPGCGKGFARQHDCKRHESLHLNVRPYTCNGCKKTFARMDALNRHRESYPCTHNSHP